MTFWQRIAHKLFGWQYILYAVTPRNLEVKRVHNYSGCFFVFHIGKNGDQFVLTKETMSPNPAHLGVLMATVRDIVYSDPVSFSANHRRAALTGGLEGIIYMYPAEDDFRPRVTGDMHAGVAMASTSMPGNIQNVPRNPASYLSQHRHHNRNMSFAPGDGVVD